MLGEIELVERWHCGVCDAPLPGPSARCVNCALTELEETLSEYVTPKAGESLKVALRIKFADLAQEIYAMKIDLAEARVFKERLLDDIEKLLEQSHAAIESLEGALADNNRYFNDLLAARGELDKVALLAVRGLEIDGAHHKQWFLEQILATLGRKYPHAPDVEEGIAP